MEFNQKEMNYPTACREVSIVSEIEEFSHGENDYKNTKSSDLISYEYAFDLQI